MDAGVLARDGRIITGLSKGDFRVFDEGQEQTLVGFAAEEQPLDIILLFDTSGSMRRAIEKVAAVARQALHELKDGDRVSVMTFDERTRVVSSFTNDLAAVERDIQGILSLRFDGGTDIDKALDDVADHFLQDSRSRRRRAILIITDNLSPRTRNEMSVIRNLWEADALVYGLIIPDPGYPVRRAIFAVMAPWVFLRVGGMDRIAEKTGGDTIRADDPGSAFPEMMRRIRSRYSLYYPTPPGKAGSFRSIRVEMAADAKKRFPEARVYARRGYKLTRPQ